MRKYKGKGDKNKEEGRKERDDSLQIQITRIIQI